MRKKIDFDSTETLILALNETFCEYFSLFIDADTIEENPSYIVEKFQLYFEIYDLIPEVLLFLNRSKNIKIIQDFFPFEKYRRIQELLGLEFEINPSLKKKNFLIEMDNSICSEDKPELLYHELGHLLNLKVYDFQNNILSSLYVKNPSVNATILNYWLNEIIADLIGDIICNSKKFIDRFFLLEENDSSFKYPPLLFRKSIILNEPFDIELIKDSECKKVAVLIQNNMDEIKETLQILK